MGREKARPELAGREGASRDWLWTDFSYVASSTYREKVLNSLAERPKLPKQLSQDTGLRIVHVSRALRELRDRGLAECLTPDAKSRGRLYGIMSRGAALVAYFRTSSHRYMPTGRAVPSITFVPKIRAAFAIRSTKWLASTKGAAATNEALKGWSADAGGLTDEMWLSVDAYDEFFELVEASFGDGRYEFIREMSSHAGAELSAVKEQVMKVIPLEALAERAPIVYNKEWNYGRLEVETGRRWARFSHYDWEPTPPMCAMFRGTYEGILAARGAKGSVTETRCVRLGDSHCEYLVRW
jgi:DNA-binding transcriptional ArsR family regulator